MEVSMIGSAKVQAGSKDLGFQKLTSCNSKPIFFKANHIGFGLSRKWKREMIRVAFKAPRSEISGSEELSVKKAASKRCSQENDRSQLFVGLPIDTVSNCNRLNHVKAIAAGLKALKLLGVDGVSFPVFWGVAESEAAGKYDWSAYLALTEMVRDAGLKLGVSLCFHGSRASSICLPPWIIQAGEADPDIFFTDRAGKRYTDCLSLAIDGLPVLAGKAPMQVFGEFLDNFKSTFSCFLGSTITDISVGLGPDGELRYPSFPSNRGEIPGVGEFQCYDRYMLQNLKQQAESTGHRDWGHSGPHDVPTYDHRPDSGAFFKEHGGSWETPYGDFFLSWYSEQLVSHGDRLLSLAARTFEGSPVSVSGKVPLVHWWFKTRSHPSELTAGFYNNERRDGYEAIAKMFDRNSCTMVLPGMDLSDRYQSPESRSSPEGLLSQILTTCEKHGVSVSGENSSVSGVPGSFERIKENLTGRWANLGSFTYQRMGAYFFSPEHFPLFTGFVRSLDLPEKDADDLPGDEEVMIPLTPVSEQEKAQEMQTA